MSGKNVRDPYREKTTVFVLSPHYDDAALSLALMMRAWSRADVRVVILNFFTQSDHAPHSQLWQKLAYAAMEPGWMLGYLRSHPGQMRRYWRTAIRSALRHREDLAFRRFYRPALASLDLHFLDAPVRNPGQRLFVSAETEETELAGQLRTCLSAALPPGGLVLAPLALGGHVDHLAVCAAARAVVGPERLAYYEDIPYALDAPPELIAARAAERVAPAEPIFIRQAAREAGAGENKRHLISIYKSQFPQNLYEGMAAAAEGIWASPLCLANNYSIFAAIDPGLGRGGEPPSAPG